MLRVMKMIHLMRLIHLGNRSGDLYSNQLFIFFWLRGGVCLPNDPPTACPVALVRKTNAPLPLNLTVLHYDWPKAPLVDGCVLTTAARANNGEQLALADGFGRVRLLRYPAVNNDQVG